jgi:hypothetical protein
MSPYYKKTSGKHKFKKSNKYGKMADVNGTITIRILAVRI